MQLESKTFLFDILDAARGVREAVALRSFAEYASDRNFRWAVERGCTIIGEALSQLRKLDPGLAETLTDWRGMIAFRNVIVHGYAIVDSKRVWDIATNHLPKLIDEVERLLAE